MTSTLSARQEQLAWQWLGFTVIAFCVLLVYYPSLLHVARSDQIPYLAEVANKHTWYSLAIQTYDLNRHRQFFPGDEFLFRPVLYFILGNERFFFGYNFLLWQAAALLAHLWVVWSLLKLLLCIHRGIFAVLWAGFFALLYINMEMVTWHHISSYMFFWGLVLNALYHSYAYVYRQRREPWRLWVIGGLLLPAVFTYEIGNIYAVLLFIFFRYCCPKDKNKNLFTLFLIPVFLYVCASMANYWWHGVQSAEGEVILNPMSLASTLKNIGIANVWWMCSGLFPHSFDLQFIARSIVPQDSPLVKPLSWMDPAVILSFGLMVVYFGNLLRGGFQSVWRARGSFLILLGLMILLYTVTIIVGRGNSRIFRLILGGNLYYNYSFWVLASVGIYASVAGHTIHKHIKILVAGALIALMLINGALLKEGLDKQVADNNDITVLIRTLELLIKEHGKESDFSFYVANEYPGNYVYGGLHRPTEPPESSYSVVQAFYPEYYTTDHPKYRFLTIPKK